MLLEIWITADETFPVCLRAATLFCWGWADNDWIFIGWTFPLISGVLGVSQYAVITSPPLISSSSPWLEGTAGGNKWGAGRWRLLVVLNLTPEQWYVHIPAHRKKRVNRWKWRWVEEEKGGGILLIRYREGTSRRAEEDRVVNRAELIRRPRDKRGSRSTPRGQYHYTLARLQRLRCRLTYSSRAGDTELALLRLLVLSHTFICHGD